MRQITFHHVSETGQQITSYLITATTDEWADRPESTSPLWEACITGESVLAMTVTVNDAMASSVAALPSDSRRN